MTFAAEKLNPVTLEAPGEFLSGLLGVSQAQVLSLRAGGIRAIPAEFGVWRVVAPLRGSLRIAAGDLAWPLETRQCAVLEGKEELSLLPTEDGELGLIVLKGEAADRVFAECRRQGGLFFARVFRQAVGVNPREYARRHEAPQDAPPQEDRLYVL